VENADASRIIQTGEDRMAKETKAKATRKPAAPRTRPRKAATPITRADIERRAYQLHLEGSGDELGNWLRAERELVTA
jgi:hypothetical protein